MKTDEEIKNTIANNNNFDSFERAIRYTFGRELLSSEKEFINKIINESMQEARKEAVEEYKHEEDVEKSTKECLQSNLNYKGFSEKALSSIKSIRSNYDLWKNEEIKDGAFSWHLHNNLIIIEKSLSKDLTKPKEVNAQKWLLENGFNDVVTNGLLYSKNTPENAKKWIYVSDILKLFVKQMSTVELIEEVEEEAKCKCEFPKNISGVCDDCLLIID